MIKDRLGPIRDILHSIARIEEYTGGLDEAAFCGSSEKQDAVHRRLEIIGEAARRVDQTLRDANPQIPWPKMIALRNLLAHEYDHIICTVVWDTITLALPNLKEQLTDILLREC